MQDPARAYECGFKGGFGLQVSLGLGRGGWGRGRRAGLHDFRTAAKLTREIFAVQEQGSQGRRTHQGAAFTEFCARTVPSSTVPAPPATLLLTGWNRDLRFEAQTSV